MAQTDLAVRIATIFDEAGIKKADKSINKLQKSTSKLGRALGISLGTAAVAAFGRAAAKAFSEDAKSTATLTNAVRNLGLAFEQTNINTFISSLEKSASIADEVLRPAFQSLLTTTGSVTEAQKLLKVAIDASRGTGYDLATVAGDLSKAYVGNTKGLQKYYLGLSRAQLASMSFEEIQAKITKTFKGANKAYLNTSAGKVEALSIATGNFSETVGGALVNALIAASGSSGIEGLVGKIDHLAQSTVNAINEFQKFAFITAYAFNPKNIFKGGDKFTNALNEFISKQQMAGAGSFNPLNNAVSGYTLYKKAAADAKKLADQQAKLLKISLAANKALTAEQKKQDLLKKAGSIFDLDQIQLIAALKGKLSEEDRKRVELQFALIVGNTAEAQSLTYELAKAQGLGEHLANYLATLPDAKNPFASWAAYLDMLQAKAQQVASVSGAVVVTATSTATNVTGGGAIVQSGQNGAVVSTNVSALPSSTPGSFRAAEAASNLTGPIQVNVQIDGKTIATANQSQSLSGIPSNVSRVNGMFTG